MSVNVISLCRHQQQRATGLGALLQGFAQKRRPSEDVYWLKENAEILNILECTNLSVSAQALETYQEFYDTLPDRLAFFPQYYRFFTSIACDLEALGLRGNIAAQACDFVAENALLTAELSDLQRAEAVRLLARRGHRVSGAEALHERLHSFINHSPNFAVPNRKAAYELTHIVFYLSEYGRRDPELHKNAVQSLIFAGLLAYLEQNLDLLSEICVALRYARQVPPTAWERWIKSCTFAFHLRAQDDGAGDQYHEYLVANWACAQMGGGAFQHEYSPKGSGFYSAVAPLGALGAVSEALLQWEGARSASWDLMERKVYAALPADIAAHLSDVTESSTQFAALFEHFSRADHGKVAHRTERKSPRLEHVR